LFRIESGMRKWLVATLSKKFISDGQSLKKIKYLFCGSGSNVETTPVGSGYLSKNICLVMGKKSNLKKN